METDKEEDATCNHKNGGNFIVGVKRSRTASKEQDPSVHVTYNSLTRNSKRKLEELLQQWSEWHALQASSSQGPNEVLESGEETYFPALCVGLKNVSAVSFRIDNQTLRNPNQELISLDSESAPLYDREFALGLMSEDASKNSDRSLIIEEASRCFNCGSYSHSLKECKKPRDSVAISSARKQHNTKRNHNNGSRLPTRYYQDTPAGKYDGLKPGVLDAETQKLLGIGELDPPPWLNRMREIGYPPGYLDPVVDDEPSGITIFGEEPPQQQEDGEILDDIDYREPPKKMSVGFPGINAPIPQKANERSWAARASNPDSSRNHSRRRHVVSSEEPTSIGHNHERRASRAALWDDGPPGVDPLDNPNTSSSYPPRYGSNMSSSSSYSSRGTFPSPHDSGLGRYENWSNERQNGYGYASDYSLSTHDERHYCGRR